MTIPNDTELLVDALAFGAAGTTDPEPLTGAAFTSGEGELELFAIDSCAEPGVLWAKAVATKKVATKTADERCDSIFLNMRNIVLTC